MPEAFIEFPRADSAADARRHWAITANGEVVGLIGLLREYSMEDDLSPVCRLRSALAEPAQHLVGDLTPAMVDGQ